jgi:hypothetical protein
MKKRTKKSKKTASVVPQKYRDSYENDSCGDDVSIALKKAFGSREEFDLAGLTRCLKDNDCKIPNVDMKGHGAIGRFRIVLVLRYVLLSSETATSSSLVRI